MANVLVVGSDEKSLPVIINVLLEGGHNARHVSTCEDAAKIFEGFRDTLGAVIIDDMYETIEKNAAWLADVITEAIPDLPVIIVTDESPTAIIYREAEQTGALLLRKKGLTTAILTEAVEAATTKE